MDFINAGADVRNVLVLSIGGLKYSWHFTGG